MCAVTMAVSAQRISPKGFLILGDSTQMRAVSPFKAANTCLTNYVSTIQNYRKHLGKDIRIYMMTIPTSAEFYAAKDEDLTRRQTAAINYGQQLLGDAAITVQIADTLFAHRHEAIYSRTDHHWQPLGAFYAAREFARVADVPFMPLDNYETRYVHNFCGTMPKFAAYPKLREYPEEFIYYVPMGVEYESTFIKYTLDKSRLRVVSETAELPDNLFREYKDGSGAAYCTFLGGDCNLAKIVTNTHNGRRLLILKDSYGNALPSFLLYSFERICVVDCRYFTKNIVDYIQEQGITDVLFANNMGHASTPRTCETYTKYLTQHKKSPSSTQQ